MILDYSYKKLNESSLYHDYMLNNAQHKETVVRVFEYGYGKGRRGIREEGGGRRGKVVE